MFWMKKMIKSELSSDGCTKQYQQSHWSKSFRALDKREYLGIIRDNFCQFWMKTYVVNPHLNCLWFQ